MVGRVCEWTCGELGGLLAVKSSGGTVAELSREPRVW